MAAARLNAETRIASSGRLFTPVQRVLSTSRALGGGEANGRIPAAKASRGPSDATDAFEASLRRPNAHSLPRDAVAAAGALGIRCISPDLFCGPRPDRPMLDQLRALGVKTVLNLENYHTYWGWLGWRARSRVEAAGMKMVRHPVSPVWFVGKRRVDRIVALISDRTQGPFYVHCLFGKERTNFVVALYRRIREAMPEDKAMTAMLDDGFRPGYVPLLASQVPQMLSDTQPATRAD